MSQGSPCPELDRLTLTRIELFVAVRRLPILGCRSLLDEAKEAPFLHWAEEA